jgi:hypothetical protein
MGALIGGLVMGLLSEEDAVAFVPDLCGNARRRFLRSREIRLSTDQAIVAEFFTNSPAIPVASSRTLNRFMPGAQ